ncbi:all trans-polyprenyl-diphosphate synthase PDSS2-like [Oratosquilla oratoria]|uniref:all trans-polyprenyl-diphosphate synthase PDSS2-like n=1 Tax=Oratosquilla oratoria TaxID=337810 RepID=UPI003F75B23E
MASTVAGFFARLGNTGTLVSAPASRNICNNILSRGGSVSRSRVTPLVQLGVSSSRREDGVVGNSINYSTAPVQHRKPDWNRAVSDAEKIVGYPTSYLTLRSLLSDEMSNIAVHMRKLVGTSHPLLKTAKRLIYNGRNNMQTRGLIVLLISKAAGHLNPEELEQDRPAGVSHSQRSLAEITEMIHTAHLIHKGVVNLSSSIFTDGTTLEDMQFGNKIAILSGDYLLANACTGLAGLRNTQVVELIGTAISDFMEAEFMGDRDNQGNPVPLPSITIKEWEEKNYMAAGSLMAKSCQATMVLSGHDTEMQSKGFNFGKNIALAWQAHSELQPFTDLYRHPPGMAFDLTSAPVILHLLKDPSIMDIISPMRESVENCDFKKLHSHIMEGTAVDEAKDLCQSYANAALNVLKELEATDARTALENIIHALKDY